MVLTLESLSPYDWALRLSILNASNDCREAPWYGAWNMVLVKGLFHDFCPKRFYTVTYPQFPLVKDIDTVSDSEEEGSDKVRFYYSLPHFSL